MVEFSQIDELNYLTVSNKSARAKIALQGAHIFEYQAVNKTPLLWLSKTSSFQKGKAIRGGVPICWPWFGEHSDDKNLPNHGFARTSLWKHIETKEISESESAVTLILKNSPESMKLFPYLFELSLEVIVGDQLKISLTTKNLDNKTFVITQALHSYFYVSDISEASVDGVDKKEYYNKVDNSFNNLQSGKLIFIDETDRIYQNINRAITLNDKDKKIIITTDGSNSAVIWNPGSELAQKMSDLSDHSTMLCIESANVLHDQRRVEPDQSHTLTAVITQ